MQDSIQTQRRFEGRGKIYDNLRYQDGFVLCWGLSVVSVFDRRMTLKKMRVVYLIKIGTSRNSQKLQGLPGNWR